MRFTPITPATLELDAQGVPVSTEFDDIYHSASGALDQARHVFLRGNGLPQRWQGREQFVIVETGFGLGHNFLSTWQAWRDDPASCGRLHFISVEKHPFKASDLGQAHAHSGAPAELSAQLTRQWPLLVPGFHRLEFDGGRVLLTLLFGEAADMLSQCVAQADAIFLDGFAPARNPDIWSPAVFTALAKLSHDDTTLATWSVFAAVREGLTAAGFSVEKAPGFHGKHWMLRGHFTRGTRAATSLQREAIVIGAGLAGTAICERLAMRGWTLHLLESGPAPAQGASGNIAGAFRPQPSRDDNLMARITRAAFIYGLQDLTRLEGAGHAVQWSQCGVLHLARDAGHERKLQDTMAALNPPPEFMQWRDADAASALAGQRTASGGWWFPLGGWINPPSLCAARLAKAGSAVSAHFNCHVAQLQHDGECWLALDAQGQCLARAPHLVLANGHDARRLFGQDGMPLESARGQVSHLATHQFAPLDTVVCGSGYVTPAVDGLHAMGATFVVNDLDLSLRETEHADNLDKLGKMLPGSASGVSTDTLAGRASLRPISPDRLPFVGALSGNTPGNDAANNPGKNLWVLTAFGARGLTWGALCAELLACQMNNEPLPLERALCDAQSPIRYRPSPG